jgi:hypothetical protein
MLQRPAGEAAPALRAMMQGVQRAWNGAAAWAAPSPRSISPSVRKAGAQPAPAAPPSKQKAWAGSPGQFRDRPQILNALDAAKKAGASPVGLMQGKTNDIRLLQNFYSKPENSPVANQYDLSTNMFLRYLAGTGATGLELNREQGKAIRSAVDEAEGVYKGVKGKDAADHALKFLERWRGQGHVDKVNRGEVPVYFGQHFEGVGPPGAIVSKDRGGRGDLHHSLGSFWARREQGGVIAIDEDYDFIYAPGSRAMTSLKPEQREAMAKKLKNSPNPAHVGRGIVMAGYGTPFSYGLQVAPSGDVQVTPGKLGH